MTRRQRLMKTLRGEKVDRPAVSFYEIGLHKYDPDDPSPYNVHNDPSWRPLIQLAEEKTDLIRRAGENTVSNEEIRKEFFSTEAWDEESSKFTKTTLTIAGRTMTHIARRDAGVDTVWVLEHFIKNNDDLKAYLQIPNDVLAFEFNGSNAPTLEAELDEAGIIMFNTPDPLCLAAQLFPMGDYTIIALAEPELFHQLLEKLSLRIYENIQKVAAEFPGRLWRIFGPEYASAPYLPPRLFEEYVVRYTGPMVKMIQETGGYARIHSHGNLRNILPHIVAMGADGLDPIEPPPQGDIELCEVREKFGQNMVLFGNIEITDIENLSSEQFEPKVVQALREGTAGEGRGFVLLPSASPYGRTISAKTMKNYETMVRLTENWQG